MSRTRVPQIDEPDGEPQGKKRGGMIRHREMSGKKHGHLPISTTAKHGHKPQHTMKKPRGA